MVICVIDINSVAMFVEPKSYAPITRHRYGVMSSESSGQGMESEPRYVHVSRSAARVEDSENAFQFSQMFGRNPSLVAVV